jgi:hypothetical protein
MYEYVGGAPYNAVDPSGETPVHLTYYAIRIGIAAFAAAGVWNHTYAGTAPWETLLGNTDPGEVASTSFEAGAGGDCKKVDDCPTGSHVDTIFHRRMSRLWPWDADRELKINVVWNYSKGNIAGHLDYAASGTLPSGGFAVVGINVHIYEKEFECECKTHVPCVSGSVQVRRVIDQPWPSNNVDTTNPYRFEICADGTGP